jgi:hypothetical protein
MEYAEKYNSGVHLQTAYNLQFFLQILIRQSLRQCSFPRFLYAQRAHFWHMRRPPIWVYYFQREL